MQSPSNSTASSSTDSPPNKRNRSGDVELEESASPDQASVQAAVALVEGMVGKKGGGGEDEKGDSPKADDDFSVFTDGGVGDVVGTLRSSPTVLLSGRSPGTRTTGRRVSSRKRKSGSRAIDRLDRGPITCYVCNKEFPSLRSVFGHLRTHPDRGHRGYVPPPGDDTPVIPGQGDASEDAVPGCVAASEDEDAVPATSEEPKEDVGDKMDKDEAAFPENDGSE